MMERLDGAGCSRAISLSELVSDLEAGRKAVSPVFSPERLDLVASVSAAILKQGAGRASPAVTHFAYWTRRQALRALAASSVARTPAQCVARPRGLAFHLPPQNVETVFLYSWVISFLCGNANLVRLPTELGEGMTRLLGHFLSALEDSGDISQQFVRYPAEEAINRRLSAICDARVVWGGDAKVAAFAPLPLRSGGKAIWFGDRRSLAMVNGDAVTRLAPEARREVAERLHNDVFVFDQMACSSPVRLFVVGDEGDCDGAVGRLLEDLSEVAIRRGSIPATGHVIRKMVESMSLAAEGYARKVARHSNSLTTLTVDRPTRYSTVGGGFLEIAYVPTLKAIAPTLEENVQTIVHFGFESEALSAFAEEIPTLSVARIVPVGEALDFDAVWDGYDLTAELTRLLRIR
jgi:Acyl-CoA reductase (LuxC)